MVQNRHEIAALPYDFYLHYTDYSAVIVWGGLGLIADYLIQKYDARIHSSVFAFCRSFVFRTHRYIDSTWSAGRP